MDRLSPVVPWDPATCFHSFLSFHMNGGEAAVIISCCPFAQEAERLMFSLVDEMMSEARVAGSEETVPSC